MGLRLAGAPLACPLVRNLVTVVVLVIALAGCSEDEARPIDLGTPDSAPTTSPDGPATPHAIGENPQARAYAEQQCRDDPDQDQGVIRIVDPATDEVLGEVAVDCDELRQADADADGAGELEGEANG